VSRVGRPLAVSRVALLLAVAALSGCGGSSSQVAGTSFLVGPLNMPNVQAALAKEGFHVNSTRISRQPPSNGMLSFLPGVRVAGLVSEDGRDTRQQGRILVMVLSSPAAARRLYGFDRGELARAPAVSRPSALAVARNVVGAYIPPRAPGTDRTSAFKRAMARLAAAGGSSPSAVISISVRNVAGFRDRSYLLRCNPSGGSLPEASRACAGLSTVVAFSRKPRPKRCQALRAAIPRRLLAVARVRGRIDGRRIAIRLDSLSWCDVPRALARDLRAVSGFPKQAFIVDSASLPARYVTTVVLKGSS
jgi:hypothetical protein